MNIGFLPNDNLTLAVIRRVDLDCDAKLNYNEFLGAVKPIEDVMPSFKKPRAQSAVRSAKSVSRKSTSVT